MIKMLSDLKQAKFVVLFQTLIQPSLIWIRIGFNRKYGDFGYTLSVFHR